MRMNRTDLALEAALKNEVAEGITLEKGIIGSLQITKVIITEKGANLINKPVGNYYTIYSNEDRNESAEIKALNKIITELFEKLNPKIKRILVAGLGNENITPDSLGVRSVSRVAATAHLAEMREREFEELGMRRIFAVETGVMAQTGMESAEQLRYIANGVKPDIIIAIDSLACSETERLGRTIQVTDTGIAPGSGVKNSRCEISQKVMGIPVVAIGVPTVIDLESLTDSFSDECADSITAVFAEANAMVVPRDIDVTINHYAKVISKAINYALNPSLTPKEIEQLLF